MELKQRELLIKKLIYRSNNRGCKETDVILGDFSKANLAQMKDDELESYSHLLTQTDPDIWDWFNGKSVPQEDALKKMMVYIRHPGLDPGSHKI